MPASKKFSHLDATVLRRWSMLAGKPIVFRRATAAGKLICAATTIRLLKKKALPKGDVLGVARIAGIQAVKRAADLIPLCHPLPINQIQVDFRVTAVPLKSPVRVETEAKTGVEMEALTGVSVAALDALRHVQGGG
jgi:cyclic pyranopterin phosphate synthase